MDSSTFQFQIIHLNSVISTNIYAHKLLQEKDVVEGVVISTDFQEKGKGQLTKRWESDQSMNLLMSILLRPSMKIDDQFEWSKMISVSIKNILDSLAVGNVQIKWPNDILVNGEKVAGTLIENGIVRNSILTSIIGIGLNVNQSKFENFQRKATSLKLRTGIHFRIEEIRSKLLLELQANYFRFKENPTSFHQKYLQSFYGLGIPMKFEDKEGPFTGVILGVLPNGCIQLNKKGKLKSYEVKELIFLE